MFLKVCTFDVDVGKSINSGIWNKAVGDRGHSDLDIFIEGHVWAIRVGPGGHCLPIKFIYFIITFYYLLELLFYRSISMNNHSSYLVNSLMLLRKGSLLSTYLQH